jgi:hypothetical protein
MVSESVSQSVSDMMTTDLSFSWVNISLHTKNQLPWLPRNAFIEMISGGMVFFNSLFIFLFFTHYITTQGLIGLT